MPMRSPSVCIAWYTRDRDADVRDADVGEAGERGEDAEQEGAVAMARLGTAAMGQPHVMIRHATPRVCRQLRLRTALQN